MWPVVVSGGWWQLLDDQRRRQFCTENLLVIAWVASRLQWTAVVCMEDSVRHPTKKITRRVLVQNPLCNWFHLTTTCQPVGEHAFYHSEWRYCSDSGLPGSGWLVFSLWIGQLLLQRKSELALCSKGPGFDSMGVPPTDNAETWWSQGRGDSPGSNYLPVAVYLASSDKILFLRSLTSPVRFVSHIH